MANSVRGAHVSPGVYQKEEELNYSVKSLGITTLGLVGETQRGPAFQPVSIENWREFQSVFGGTSTEKFRDTQYPKYELPYIAKSYLSESNQLEVCRVLGLSGYNAGPAWILRAKGVEDSKYDQSVVLVLRSRGYYDKYFKADNKGDADPCGCGGNVYVDYQRFMVGEKSPYTCTEASTGEEAVETPRAFDMGGVRFGAYTEIDNSGNSCENYLLTSGGVLSVSATNYGKFNIYVRLSAHLTECKSGNNIAEKMDLNKTDKYERGYDKVYAVSLNPTDPDYILKVLGTNPHDGTAPIYVEALYDVALKQGIESGEIDGIYIDDFELETTEGSEDKRIKGQEKPKSELSIREVYPYQINDFVTIEPVYDILTKPEGSLTRSDVGKRFLADAKANQELTYHPLYENKLIFTDKKDAGPGWSDAYTDGSIKNSKGYYDAINNPAIGEVYVVKQFTLEDGKRRYFYVQANEKLTTVTIDEKTGDYKFNATEIDKDTKNVIKLSSAVKVESQGLFYRIVNESDVDAIKFDLNNYKSGYRFASTPWFVSNVKGDYSSVEVNRLFRFHTISDGDNSNKEVKVSIENINVDENTFDVVVRDINDTDDALMVVEKFSRCTLVPGTSNFLGFKIGTADGEYEMVSKYITVEFYKNNEGVIAQNSVPCGILGYPHGFVQGYPVVGDKMELNAPVLKYNCNYNEDIKNRKQYFGLSSLVGVDIDAFTFKGVSAYVEDAEHLTNGFHLDCRLEQVSYEPENNNKHDIDITVDGESGYKFDTVSVNSRTMLVDGNPIIGTEDEMVGSIYEDKKLRKFTVYFYGGFDGWDEYRESRTNTDEFKMIKYRGQYNEISGEGAAFNKIENPESLGLNQNGITSDWYAYLAAYRQFANPETVNINLFATPGIDLYNNTLLAQEVIEMIEEERGDALYVATVPDKPSGATDYVDEMYTPEEMVELLEDTEIDSNYTCTYYPWVKYFDQDSNQYIYLPPTKDVVRNMAQTDNVSYPWFAPAGLERGDVQATRAHYVTRLADEDILYAGRINPIKTFAQDGIKIWGQKNLQVAEGQLNRIAVRRLLLRMRKLVANACLNLIFSPNDAQTRQSLQGLINPIMDNLRSNRAISDYRVEITSADATLEDRRELNVRLLFKPYTCLEYINLMFSVTPQNVSFDDI